MTHDFLPWIKAIEAGFVERTLWTTWAEQRIRELPFAPTWLVNILDATTPEEALAGFIEGSVESKCIGDTGEGIHLHLGFLWLNYQRGKQTLLGTLLAAGEFADISVSGIAPNCEEFYLLANEIDGGVPSITVRTSIHWRNGSSSSSPRLFWPRCGCATISASRSINRRGRVRSPRHFPITNDRWNRCVASRPCTIRQQPDNAGITWRPRETRSALAPRYENAPRKISPGARSFWPLSQRLAYPS